MLRPSGGIPSQNLALCSAFLPRESPVAASHGLWLIYQPIWRFLRGGPTARERPAAQAE